MIKYISADYEPDDYKRFPQIIDSDSFLEVYSLDEEAALVFAKHIENQQSGHVQVIP